MNQIKMKMFKKSRRGLVFLTNKININLWYLYKHESNPRYPSDNYNAGRFELIQWEVAEDAYYILTYRF